MKFNGDIIITDPCYIFDNEDWELYCDDFNPKVLIQKYKISNYIWEDTIFGDWDCTTYELFSPCQDINSLSNKNIKNKLGEFCADAGLVSVFYLNEIPQNNIEIDNKKLEFTRTIIRDFNGNISHVSDSMYRYLIGTGNINFVTFPFGEIEDNIS